MVVRPRTVVAALAATASASAWTFHGSSFVGRSIATVAAAPRSGPAAPTRHAQRHMAMFFGNLFSGGGGGGGGGNPFSAIRRIDYTRLDHPGPELGQCAAAGRVPSHSLRDPHLEIATFAGGCFWGLELAFQRVPGVAHTAVGYTQGGVEGPTYEEVCWGKTGHTEAVVVYFDPRECSYEALLDVFFGRIDPTQVNGQGNDRGTQYRTGVYFHTPEQEALARARLAELAPRYRQPIATELKAALPFWPAEKYHQQYLEKGGQNASKGATERIRCYG